MYIYKTSKYNVHPGREAANPGLQALQKDQNWYKGRLHHYSDWCIGLFSSDRRPADFINKASAKTQNI